MHRIMRHNGIDAYSTDPLDVTIGHRNRVDRITIDVIGCTGLHGNRHRCSNRRAVRIGRGRKFRLGGTITSTHLFITDHHIHGIVGITHQPTDCDITPTHCRGIYRINRQLVECNTRGATIHGHHIPCTPVTQLPIIITRTHTIANRIRIRRHKHATLPTSICGSPTIYRARYKRTINQVFHCYCRHCRIIAHAPTQDNRPSLDRTLTIRQYLAGGSTVNAHRGIQPFHRPGRHRVTIDNFICQTYFDFGDIAGTDAVTC